MAETGKSKGSCRLLALPSQNRNTLWPAVPCHAMPGFPVKNCLSVNAATLVQRDPLQLQGPVTVDPALSYRNMPIRSYYPHFAVHHDRPISASSLDRRRGREELSRKGRRSSYEEAVHDFGYFPLRPSEGFRQTGRLAHSRSFPSSGVSAANPAAGAVQLANPPRNEKSRMILPPRISPGPRKQDEYDMCCGHGETHQEAPDASSTCSTWAQLGRSQAASS